MMKRPCLLVCLLLAGCAGSVSESPEAKDEEHAKEERVPVLVEASWVNEHRDDENLRIIDLSETKEDYVAGHLPQAVYVDWRTEILDPSEPERYNVLPKNDMEQLLSRLGITEDSTIVIYDNLQHRLAIRLFWTLRYYNHSKLHLLNGGKEAWSGAGYEFTKDVPKVKPSEYQIAQVNEEHITDLEFIKTHLEDVNVVVIDGRPRKQFTGEEPGKVYHTGTAHQRLGHIPGARHIFWRENFAEDGRFKSIEELRKLYHDAEIVRKNTIVTYCNEGLHATPPWFVLSELLGYPDVRVYDDSMSEWANRTDVPIEQSEKSTEQSEKSTKQ